jgi:filamentous hemagglutinin
MNGSGLGAIFKMPGQEGIVALDWSRISARTGGNAAEHVTLNYGSLSLSKPNQGVFYGNPISTIEDAWATAQRNGLKPVTVDGTDIYVVPRPNSGYAGGLSGQRQNLDHVTIITLKDTNKIITGFPGNGLPFPKVP